MSDWRDNVGERPRGVRRRRIRVMLRGDGPEPYEPIYASDRDPMAPTGWAAETSRWSFSADDDPCRLFDIMRFQVVE